MCPTSTAFYSTYLDLSYSIVFGNNPLNAMVASNGNYVFISEFSYWILFAALMRAMAISVCKIVFMGVPAQIFQSVIGTIAVIMAAIHAGRLFPEKRGQNQIMYTVCFTTVIFPKIYGWARVFSRNANRLYFIGPGTPNSPKIRDFIKAFITCYWQPLFHVRMCGIT